MGPKKGGIGLGLEQNLHNRIENPINYLPGGSPSAV